MIMSTSLAQSRPSWPKPISSKILDELMSSTKGSDDIQSQEKTTPHTLQSSFKKSIISGEARTKLTSALKFTPPQLYKVTRIPLKRSNEERKEKSETSLSLEPSDVQCSISQNSRSSSCLDQSSFSLDRSFKTSPASCRTSNSSIYLTPESTPTSKTSDEVFWPQSNRSADDSCTNSSLNSSAYCTPESSPRRESDSTVKRLKSRWSNTISPIDLDNSLFTNSNQISTGSLSDLSVEPELIGYQLVGDSQFCRFGQQLLGLQRVSMPGCPGRIGICVSGQTISDLHRRVKEKFYPISEKLILMIGTNDFLKSIDIPTMCQELSALIDTLKESVAKIVLLTLPPVPKLEKKQNLYHFTLLEKYNSYIRSLEDGDKLRIADVSPMYISLQPYRRCQIGLFELYFPGPARRFDLIHLNRQGLELIQKYILEHFLYG